MRRGKDDDDECTGLGARGRRRAQPPTGGGRLRRLRAVRTGNADGVLRRQRRGADDAGRRATRRRRGPGGVPVRRSGRPAAPAGRRGRGPPPLVALRDERGQALPVRAARHTSDPPDSTGPPPQGVSPVAERRDRGRTAAVDRLPGRGRREVPAGQRLPDHPGPRSGDRRRDRRPPAAGARHRPPVRGAAHQRRTRARRGVRGPGRRSADGRGEL